MRSLREFFQSPPEETMMRIPARAWQWVTLTPHVRETIGS